MKKKALILMTFAIFAVFTLPLDAKVAVSSPDQKIEFSLDIKEKLEPYPTGRRLYYSVTYSGRSLLQDSPFRLDFNGAAPIAKDLVIKSEHRRSLDESWVPVWGKHRRIQSRCNELTLSLEEAQTPNRRIEFVVRLFNDGAAFRYAIPAQDSMGEFMLSAELSEFHFPGNPTVWAANYGSFQTHQETEFAKMKLSEIKPGDIIGCPLLVDAGAAWVALTEADLTDWAGLYFTGNPGNPMSVVSLLSPRPDKPGLAVISKAPRNSPWRVIMIGERPGDLIESEILLNLNPPCEIEDTSWIKPGISTWDRWWCGSYAPDFAGALGVDNKSMKYFVDFAADMGWDYQLVDWTWYGPPFDPKKAFGTAGNPAADLTRSIPEMDIPELVRYAAAKGVKILLWLDWFNADKQMAKAFPLYEKWGVAGVKVDFMVRDDQEMVNFYQRLVKLAAKHHLCVDFHGAYKPSGFRRTYPNLLTREGVMGNEYNKWSNRITPAHNVTLPFTRMLCGPLDFTPGGFRHKTVGTFRAVGDDAPGPFVMGTRCHQLAMMVVYESPLQVMCDSPYSYRMSPVGLDFLKAVPTTWDDIRVLDGYPGEFIVLARQSGKEWFLGAMNGGDVREIDFSLAFLGAGRYRSLVYRDAEEAADYPEHVWKEERTLTGKDNLRIKMASGGGCVVRFSPVE